VNDIVSIDVSSEPTPTQVDVYPIVNMSVDIQTDDADPILVDVVMTPPVWSVDIDILIPEPVRIDVSTGDMGPSGGTGPQGPVGPTGPAGPQGPASTVPGPAGPQGPQGVPGDDGADGATGSQGVQGPAGPAGAKGDTGNTGATGPQGIQGVPGTAGVDGATGPQGVPGTPGAEGPVGPQGPQGIQGETGAAGTGINVKGQVPDVGSLPPTGNSDGDAYIVQDTGDMWIWDTETGVWINAGPIQGPQGEQGIPGPTGPQGVKGDTGTQGPVGATGSTGATGPAGVDGATGAQGPQGVQGPIGATGATGADSTVPGPVGPTGATGAQGPVGATGAQGPQGIQGPQGVPGEDGTDGFIAEPVGAGTFGRLQTGVWQRSVATVGDRMTGGLSFGQDASPPGGPTDMTRHLSLFDGWGGFSVTSGSLNLISGGMRTMSFNGPGAVMGTGARLYLDTDPTDGMEAVNLRYLWNNFSTNTQGDARWVNVTGDTMTGPLVIADSSASPLVVLNGSVMSSIAPPAPSVRFIGPPANDALFLIDAFGTGGFGGGGFFMARATGGSPGAPSAVVAGQRMGGWRVAGYGTTGYGGARAFIHAFAAETFTDTAQGTYFSFSTTAIGTAAPQERLRLTDAGALLLQVGDPTAPLQAVPKQYLDNNYSTNAQGDTRWVNVTGDQMTGDLTVNTNLTVQGDTAVTGFKFWGQTTVPMASGGYGALTWNTDGAGDVAFVNGCNWVPAGFSWYNVLSPSGWKRTMFLRFDGVLCLSGPGMVYTLGGAGTNVMGFSWPGDNAIHGWVDGNEVGVLATQYWVSQNSVTQAAGDTRWVNVTGDTMTGGLTVGTATSENSQVTVNAAAQKGAGYSWWIGGAQRWFLGTDNYPDENGTDIGSGLTLHRYSDTGGYLGSAIAWDRKTGRTHIHYGATIYNGGGLSFGGEVGAAAWDISKHIIMHNAGYGLSVTAFHLNFVVPNGAVHGFWVGTTALAEFNASGLALWAGDVVLNRDPSAAMHATTKQYVDSRVSSGTGAYLPLTGGNMTSYGTINWVDTAGTNYIGGGTDGVGTVNNNLKIGSWFGIGFYNTIGFGSVPVNEAGIYFDVRNGFGTFRRVYLVDAITDATQAVTKQYVDNNSITPAAGDTRWVNVNGDTMTGDLRIVSGQPGFFLDGPNGSFRYLQSNTNGSTRWQIHLASPAGEGGSDGGSDFVIRRFHDNGTLIDDPFTINRRYGWVSVNTTLYVAGDTTTHNVYHDGSLGTMYRGLGGANWYGFKYSSVDGTHLMLDGADWGALALQSWVTSNFAPVSGSGNYVAKAGDVMTGGLRINYNPTDTWSQLWLSPAGGGDLVKSIIRFSGTFAAAVGDGGPRYVASIRSGFASNAWGYEHVDIWLTNQGNDENSDAKQARAVRFMLGETTFNTPVTSTGRVRGQALSTDSQLIIAHNPAYYFERNGTTGDWRFVDNNTQIFGVDGGGNATILGTSTHGGRATFQNGIYMNNFVGASNDVTHGLNMYGGSYGLAISGGRMNVVGASVYMVSSGGTDWAHFDDGGMSLHVGDAWLARDPTQPMHATTKQYVDAKFVAITGGDYVKKTGDTMTGALQVGTGVGYSRLDLGSATNSGHLGFHTPDGTRRGYVGNATATAVELAVDAGVTQLSLVAPTVYMSGVASVTSGIIYRSLSANVIGFGWDGPNGALNYHIDSSFQGTIASRAWVAAGFASSWITLTGRLTCDDIMSVSGRMYVANNFNYWMGRNSDGVWMIIDNTVGILTLTPSGQLSIPGTASVATGGIYYKNLGGANCFSFYHDGAVTVRGWVDGNYLTDYAVGSWSDRRLKQDIAPSTFDCLAAINRIPLKQYRLRVKPEPRDASDGTRQVDENAVIPVGLIAQEVGEAFSIGAYPGLNGPRGEGYWQLNDQALIAALIGSVQQLTARLETLEQRIH
jgi:hypothetical protein